MVVDKHVEPFRRIWCLYEVQRLHDLSKGKTFELELIDEGGSIATNPEMMKSVADSLETVSAATAQATIEQDKWSIWYLVADPSVRRAFGTADNFKRYASNLTGFVCQFDARLSKLLAEPLLRAAVEAGDKQTALRCIAWGAAGQQGDYLHKAMTMWSDDCLSAATVKTRFSVHPQKLFSVMAYFGNTAGVQLLREAGADPAVSDKDGRTPAHFAAENGQLEVLHLLREAGADLAAVDNVDETPAHCAALNGHLEVLQLLREAGADFAAVDNVGMTPAHYADLNGHLEVLQLLREAGADLGAVDNVGETPAHCAALNGHLEVQQLLREAGADFAAVDNVGMTPAHYADLNGHLEVLQLLREAGADLAVSDKYGRTPARYAALNGQLEVLQLLREAGAGLSAGGRAGLS
ncbi:unnamed protein product [Polarella glacialis]|uniref:Uncharacterized protein n=1 Tax=Polarella glacialis TaxID=89957 RepID=A0A813JVX1_POLGL|nr:unnamed protein product [Polarella glacialis]